jgi:hypothetical protein
VHNCYVNCRACISQLYGQGWSWLARRKLSNIMVRFKPDCRANLRQILCAAAFLFIPAHEQETTVRIICVDGCFLGRSSAAPSTGESTAMSTEGQTPLYSTTGASALYEDSAVLMLTQHRRLKLAADRGGNTRQACERVRPLVVWLACAAATVCL